MLARDLALALRNAFLVPVTLTAIFLCLIDRVSRSFLPVAPRTAPASAAIPAPTAPTPALPDTSSAPESLSHAWQLGLFTRADIEGRGRGVVGAFGLSYGVGSHLETHLAALMGREKGLEPGLTALLLTGPLKPRIGLGLPIFFHGGAFVGFRPALGVSWDPSRHLGFFAEAAGAFFPSVPLDHEKAVFIPALGVQGRL